MFEIISPAFVSLAVFVIIYSVFSIIRHLFDLSYDKLELIPNIISSVALLLFFSSYIIRLFIDEYINYRKTRKK